MEVTAPLDPAHSQATALAGDAVLVVDDEIILAAELETALQDRGASTAVATNIAAAHDLVATQRFSAAVVDHVLPDGFSDALCRDLAARGIPFVMYSGDHIADPRDFPVIPKPTTPAVVIGYLLNRMAALNG